MQAPSPILRDRLFYFRRRFRASHRVLRGLLPVAPLVNVALLVLLFFMISSSYVIQPGVVMRLPKADFRDGARPGSLVVAIPQEGMLFFNDERMTLDGLSAALGRVARESGETTLVVEADERVSHGTLMKVYDMAVAAGLQDVVLATQGNRGP